MGKIGLSLVLMLWSLQAHAFLIYGEAVNVGQGQAWGFADIDEQGEPQAVGIALSGGAMEGLPSDLPREYVLKLPSILNIPPYNHMGLDWSPHGHSPIYETPHFDFHFYFMTEEARSLITCQDEDRDICLMQPDPQKIPEHFVSTPEGVPQMGWHWFDPRSPEYNGGTFTSTLIYGFYGGEMAFIEPMVTREFMLMKASFEAEIPQAEQVPAGYHPQSYSVEYNAPEDMYRVTLKQLVKKP